MSPVAALILGFAAVALTSLAPWGLSVVGMLLESRHTEDDERIFIASSDWFGYGMVAGPIVAIITLIAGIFLLS